MNNPSDSDKQIVNFLFEAGILAKTPRSGFHFLGTGAQSVAEHTARTAHIGYALAMMEEGIDVGKVLKMCLLHDFSEARTSDLNYVHQKYATADHQRAIADVAGPLPFGRDVLQTIEEYEQRQSRESILAKDADNLEWALSMKEQIDCGNHRAADWMENTIKRLKTDNAKRLAEAIRNTDSIDWFFSDKHDQWWVSRNRE